MISLSMVQNISKTADLQNIIGIKQTPDLRLHIVAVVTNPAHSLAGIHLGSRQVSFQTLGSFPDVQPTNSALIFTFLVCVSNNLFCSVTLGTKYLSKDIDLLKACP